MADIAGQYGPCCKPVWLRLSRNRSNDAVSCRAKRVGKEFISDNLELKKSYRADLEHKRTTHFLLGLTLVLALLYTAFEYVSPPAEDGRGNEMTDEMSEDLELMPAMDTRDMIAAAPNAAPHSVTEKLKAVDKEPDMVRRLDPNNGDAQLGTGGQNGQTVRQDDANPTAALPQTAPDDSNPLHFRIVEKLPEFPGGMVELMKWLTHNLHYPALAQRQRLEGKVVVSFIINKDGSVTGEKIEKGIDPLLDQEALRVVKIMPKWKPGVEKNKPCRTLFVIPINFKL